MEKDNQDTFNEDLEVFLTDEFKELLEVRKNEANLTANRKKVIYSTLWYLFRIAIGLDCIFIAHWYTLGAFWLGWCVLNMGFDLGQVYARYKDRND